MGRVGFEPTTDRLRADCSTAELATHPISYNPPPRPFCSAMPPGSGPIVLGYRQQRLRCGRGLTPFGQQGRHQQGQGLAVATGLAPNRKPLLQQTSRQIGIVSVRSWPVCRSRQPLQEGAGIIKAGIAGAEAIEAGIEGRQECFELGAAQTGQGVWTHAAAVGLAPAPKHLLPSMDPHPSAAPGRGAGQVVYGMDHHPPQLRTADSLRLEWNR